MKNIPNILTLSNLFCGSFASILMIQNSSNINWAFFLILASLIFDFFDGFAARLTKTSGEFGKQLDSLADMISFGFFPGILMVNMLENSLDELTILGEMTILLKYIGLLITLFSALRLAKFNLDTEQTYYFKGLPTPANTIFIFSLFIIQKNYNVNFLENFYSLSLICLGSSYILIANLPLFALKFKDFRWKNNSIIFSFLLLCIICVFLFKVLAIPFLIITYIIISIIFRKQIISNGIKSS